MAKLAILGHATRGKEVIEILEMLGGVNTYAVSADEEELPFTIRDDDSIMVACYPTGEFVIYTLEEFLEKFPYKVGDKVSSKYLKNYKIERMEWEDANNRVIYKLKGMGWYNANELQPYKEETVGEINIMDHTTEINLNHPCFKGCNEIELIIPKGWEFKRKDNKMFGVRKQLQYPKTYKECCDALGLKTMDNDAQGYKAYLIISFQELLIARDAYWKIAGEQMGLDKPWEPDWEDETEIYYTISYDGVNIKCYNNTDVYSKLAFPTTEVRDTFYDNFKDMIEECKTFL